METPQTPISSPFDAASTELTARLWPALVQARARVATVSSRGHINGPVDFDDIHFERRPYDPAAAYGQSKSANALFAVWLDRLGKASGMRAFSWRPQGRTVPPLTNALEKCDDRHQAHSPHRHHRHRRDRRELDRAVSRQGTAGHRDRHRAERRGRAEEIRRDRLAGAQAIGPVARRLAVEPEVHGRSRAGARRRRPRPGERARADRFQAEALWAAGRAAAARRDHRIELVGAHHERNPDGRRVPSRALRHRPSVQSAPLDPAGRDRRRGKDLGSDDPARSGILYVDRAADGAPQQGNAGPRRQPPAGARWRARSITSLPRAS